MGAHFVWGHVEWTRRNGRKRNSIGDYTQCRKVQEKCCGGGGRQSQESRQKEHAGAAAKEHTHNWMWEF